MHFIVTMDDKKASLETQRLIRSQVMKGKNRDKSRRAKQRRSTNWTSVADPKPLPPVPLGTLIEAYYSAIPGRIGSDLSCAEFAAGIGSAAFGDVIRCGLLLLSGWPWLT
jgi:hypothetical protein